MWIILKYLCLSFELHSVLIHSTLSSSRRRHSLSQIFILTDKLSFHEGEVGEFC
jgi:hypothetical protein